MNDVQGTIYLLHFHEPFHHARHYLGWTEGPVEDRLERHRRGQGARLVEVVTQAGITFEVAATWPGTRNDERRMKNRHGSARFCPICRREKQMEKIARDLRKYERFNKWYWLPEYRMRVYVRATDRIIDGVRCRTLDLANVEIAVKWRGRGLFTAFLSKFEKLAAATDRDIFIENVMEPRLAEFFRVRGYHETVVGQLPCFYLRNPDGNRS